jgi:SAM-dependent methyltransferase
MSGRHSRTWVPTGPGSDVPIHAKATMANGPSPRFRWALGVALAVVGTVFFWLFPLKFLSRLAARLGKSAPCPAALAPLVDNPLRQSYIGSTLERIGIRPGESVLELGPGPGAFTVDAARRAGAGGRVIALDIQPQMVTLLQKRVRKAGLYNVTICVASAHDLPLPNGSVDRAFLVTVLPEIPDQDRALAELRRVIRPGGVLSISEEFIDPDYAFPFETLRRTTAAGFGLAQRFGSFVAYTVNLCRGDES